MSTSPLFAPTKLGRLTLAHRVVMCPLTRFRSDDNHVILPHVHTYYGQRASVPGTFMVTEATFIHPKAGGLPNAPGLYSEDQIKAWKKVADTVHAKGSYIYLQLWALGRSAMPSQLEKEGGLPYVAPSPIPPSNRPEPVPRALTKEEIKEYLGWYAEAAHNAVFKAGFDGVEIHGANGFLIDQFMQDVSNHRDDEYGGSIENRARFALEVIDTVTKVVGQDRTAFRMSPWSPTSDMGMKDPVPQFSYFINQVAERFPDLSYLHVVERRLGNANDDYIPGTENDFIRDIWTAKGKKLISAGGHTLESGLKHAEKGDLVAYGRLFISNPDLPFRLKNGISAEKGDRNLYYAFGSSDPKGYTDYPFSEEFEKELAASQH